MTKYSNEDTPDLVCYICGNEVIEVKSRVGEIAFRCKTCEEELGRFAELEGDIEEVKKRLDFAITEYEKIAKLYTDLQDYIKILTR